jgi:hypothetical protein
MQIFQSIEITLINSSKITISVGNIQSMSCDIDNFYLTLSDGTQHKITLESYRECVNVYRLMLKGKYLH